MGNWIIYGDEKLVLDVSAFKKHHPGGGNILNAFSRSKRDSKNPMLNIFNGVGHSKGAYILAEKFIIGKLEQQSSKL